VVLVALQFVDTQCDKIAKYLQSELNLLAKDNYSFKFVNTYRNWDDRNIPVIDYPCLKVFREADVFALTGHKSTSQIRVEYGVILTANYKYVPALNQIGKYIHTLITYIHEHDNEIMISNSFQPSGRIIFTEGTGDYIFGWYSYEFAVEDNTIPKTMLHVFQ
jgi:hypothetical protein